MYRFQEPDSPSPGNPGLSNTSLSVSDEGPFPDIWQNSLDTFEDTAAVEFTAEISAPFLTATKPRRAKKTATFQIHDDTKEERGFKSGSRPSGNAKTGFSDGKPAVLCQPAQRFQRPKNSLALHSSHESRPRTTLKSNTTEMNSLLAEKRKAPAAQKKERTGVRKDVLKKDLHRETVYIPSDTTTLPSSFMGLFSPLKPQNLHGLYSPQSEDPQTNNLEAQGAKKQRLKTSVTVPPRRAPLQQTTKFVQESTTTRDVIGKNGGKENLPPGSLETIYYMKSGKEEYLAGDVQIRSVKLQSTSPISSESHANRKPLSTTTSNKTNIASRKFLKRTQWCEANASSSLVLNDAVLVRPSKTKPAATKKSISVTKVCSTPILQASPTEARMSTKPSLPSIIKACAKQKYPLLTEDISNTAMYEDNWLSHQEIAITQLANSLFDSEDQKLDGHDPDMLLHDLLKVYQDGYFTLLYKRLQASILYGGLSIPKDMLNRGNRLKEDLGLKRTFLNLWLETYNLSALRAAAETVIGRKIITTARMPRNGNISASHQQKTLKKALEAFLDTFLLRNEDMEPTESMMGEASLCCGGYRRTILRSILMIVLLDRGRLRSESSLPRLLFTSSSKQKSSAEVLQALAHILLPSVGDITRTLSHLDCQVIYKQNPLQEYEFQINNLAVDLRDGVLLTRLVELLFPLVSCPISQQHRVDGSMALRTNNTVQPPLEHHDWPLSQHLKFPCVSRATKLYNVQIALDAFFGVKGVGSIAKGVSAEDIVDGYREKTIGLLWALVGKFGLSGLVDWGEVKKEIVRLKRKAASQIGEQVCRNDEPSENGLDTEHEKHIFLLRQWASILAKLKGLRLENLTTSFADGKIFESIVDEYEDYITSGKHQESPMVKGPDIRTHREGQSSAVSLGPRLRSLGCSSQFGKSVNFPPLNVESKKTLHG